LTLDDIKAMDKEFLTPAEVAEYIGAFPQNVREGIRAGVPWGYVLGKSRFVIPRKAFVHYHEKGAVIGE
jgi:hypothetical protein